MKKIITLELEYDFLKRVAKYYEFPFLIFLGKKQMLQKKTRYKTFSEKAEKYDRLIEYIEDLKNDQ